MRKMYSENQIIDVIIRAIESGLIPIGSDVESFEGTSLLPTDVVFENWTLHRAIKIGDILWIVLAGKIKNNGSASATINNVIEITLPENISSKIYRMNGTNCSQSPLGDGWDLCVQAEVYWSGNPTRLDIVSNAVNKITLTNVGKSLSSGSSAIANLRVPLFLDIGE